MAKIKRHRGAKKRFKKTGGGGFKHRASNRNHNNTKKKSRRNIRHLRNTRLVNKSDTKAVQQMLSA